MHQQNCINTGEKLHPVLQVRCLYPAGVVHGDTLFLVGNLQSPHPNERPVLPTVIVMCQFHFPSQTWTRLRLRTAPEICHYPLLAADGDQLVLFGGEIDSKYHAYALMPSGMFLKAVPAHLRHVHLALQL